MGSTHKVLSEKVLESGQEAPWQGGGYVWGRGGVCAWQGGGEGQEVEDSMKVIILKAEATSDRRGEDLDRGALQFPA